MKVLNRIKIVLVTFLCSALLMFLPIVIYFELIPGVEASNEEDAINKVHDMYNDCEIVLDADDFVGPVNIECVK